MQQRDFENKVMEMLLAGESDYLADFRMQYLNCKVISREFTGCGFFSKFEVDNRFVKSNKGGRIDDVKGRLINHMGEYLFFILYIEKGKIDTLECFTTMETGESDYENVKLEYCYTDKRDYEIV